MALRITPDQIQELSELKRDPYGAGIKLTTDGWEVVEAGLTQGDGLVALWASYVREWADGAPLDEAQATFMIDDGGYARAVPDEYGDDDEPRDGAEVTVVTGFTGANGDVVREWDGAWWFDRAAARLVLGEERGAYRERGTATELWLTASGRWVERTQTVAGATRDYWVSVGSGHASDAVAAARLVYQADPRRLAEDPPPLAVAARAASDLVDALAPKDGEGDPRETGASSVHACRAISELLRGRVARDLRDTRGNAAHAVAATFGAGGEVEAARYLAMAPSTLAGLLDPYAGESR